MIDMTGQRIGKLVVKERDYSKKAQAAYWICQCDCGNIVSIRGSNLRDKRHPTQSCGCLSKEKAKENIDTTSLVGKTFGYLKVIERDLTKPTGHGHNSYWICQCERDNNIVSVARQELVNGKTKSCGCLRQQILRERNTLDLTNQKFGKLTALKNTFELAKDGTYIWQCKCECGNTCLASVKKLREGYALSCGCKAGSLGQQKIRTILEKNNISYQQEYTLKNCKNPATGYDFRFDFAIFNEDGTLNRLVEYDGQQHFKSKDGFMSQALEWTQYKDKIKNQYCQQNNITLIRIPYYNFRKISLDMIMKDNSH